MAKKKSKKSSSVNMSLILFIIAFIAVIFLLGQLEIKEKELRKYKKADVQEQAQEKEAQNKIKKEKIPVLTEKQELLAKRQIKENLETIIGRKPKMADKWFLSNIVFKEENLVTVFYEDGHEAGELSMKVLEPSDYKSWKRLEK
ncbi:MAG: hypothetical protein A2231_04505 [Candidatus Firestonebacteria bacterium RIFOXYA2_FULL_40_8]|nr:MAG: hypothetical protein A2231_04505 [Candidatus Firestonebacteria bacterium RIFOXYA2_FULL_40_8]